MMKLSVMLFPFHRMMTEGTLSHTDFLQTIKAEGVRAIEPMLSWVDAEPNRWREFQEAAVDAGMVFSCLDIGVDLVGESEADRALAVDTAVRGIAFCREALACPLALLAGSKARPELGDAASRKVYGESLAKVVERTRGSGVTVCIEDFGVYPDFTAAGAHCLEVLEAAGPEVKFVFDNGNFLLGDDRPTKVYPMLKPHTVHVHIKDFALRPSDDGKALTSPSGRQYANCPAGEGEAEVRECLRLLKGDGYNGWLSSEVGGDPVREAVHTARLTAAVWGESP